MGLAVILVRRTIVLMAGNKVRTFPLIAMFTGNLERRNVRGCSISLTFVILSQYFGLVAYTR